MRMSLVLPKYSDTIHATFVDNITGQYDVDFCMFKAQLYFKDTWYSCERIYNKKDGLMFIKDKARLYGLNIEAQDPRIFTVGDKVYVVFICLSPYPNQERCLAITLFDEWNPVYLQVEGIPYQPIEKNWAPFEKNNQLYFIYNYDPFVVLQYDFNPEGMCKVVFTQTVLPFDTSVTFLRGGSNLIHYKDEYYIGGCHSRLLQQFTDSMYNYFEHYTHFVVVNTLTWELVYVSEPIQYTCPLKESLGAWAFNTKRFFKPLDTDHGILVDKSPNLIQDPISLYQKDDRYFLTVNIRDAVTLLYELTISPLNLASRPIGVYDALVKKMITRPMKITDSATA